MKSIYHKNSNENYISKLIKKFQNENRKKIDKYEINQNEQKKGINIKIKYVEKKKGKIDKHEIKKIEQKKA
jgi:hypothetical protein